MNFICLEFTNIKNSQISDILIALLSELKFDMFEETDNSLNAYIPKSIFDEAAIHSIIKQYAWQSEITYSVTEIPYENWNALWESNYDPILINDTVYIYAPTHKNFKPIKYAIEINPKMSFGTGHHETTKLMIRQMLHLNMYKRNVLDIGTGTGVLAILAEKMGANSCLAIENDRNCVINAVENCLNNKSMNISVLEGDINNLGSLLFEVALANISKNVILDYLPVISKSLKTNAVLLASGFYRTDLNTITNKAQNHQLKLVNVMESMNWCCAHYTKLETE